MSSIIDVRDDTFQAEVLGATLPVLVYFWASWSSPCKTMRPMIEDAASRYAGRLKVVYLDIEENPDTAYQYHVLSVPSMIIFKKGTLVELLKYMVTATDLESFIMRNL